MNRSFFALGLFLFSGSLFAVDVDQLFEAQNKPVHKSTSVDSEVYQSTDDSSRAVRNRVEEMNEQRRQMYRSAEPMTAPEKSRSGWKVIKSYESGFAEFGFDKPRTIFVVRCGGGAEHRMYRDDRGKWGTVGVGWNNAFSSLEDAASNKCDG